MHIPDGYLSPRTCATLYAAAAPFWYVALRRVGRALHGELVPLIGLFSAFCFVVMMFNLPLPGGTTGHAVGMGVAAIVLGPWASILAISTALVIQALLFGDGGITAIGANCFNMAVVGSLVAYWCYRALAGNVALGARRRVFAAAVAGYAAINASAFCAAIEFGIQPALFHDASGTPLYCPYPLAVALPAMMIGHLTFAGVAESILTGGVISYLQKADAAVLRRTAPRASSALVSESGPPPKAALHRYWPVLAFLVVLTPLGIFAIGSAWGEWSANDFSDPAVRQQMSRSSSHFTVPDHAPAGIARLFELWRAPLARYAPPFVKSASSGYMLSAAIGTIVILGTFLLVSRLSLLVLARRGIIKAGFVEGTIRSLFEALERSLFAEETARGHGLLQRLEPRVKLAGIMAVLLAAMSVQSVPVLLALLIGAVAVMALSRVPFAVFAKAVWLPSLLLSVLILLPALLMLPGTPLVQLPWLHLTITAQGAKSVALLLSRVETAVTLSGLLFFTTEWARLLRALRFFGLPVTAVVVLGSAYRYLFVLLRASQEMFESRRSRLVGELTGRESRRVAASSAGALLSRTIALSAEVHSAMRSRGYEGEVFLLDDSRLQARDYFAFAGLLAIAVFAFVAGR